ncbi:hypothetical protein HS7_12080 [Sulfolobales archaeon HS-7]|nr:hypothetical protein HS7_12080 [Sulfolobales archaeon HS-7]
MAIVEDSSGPNLESLGKLMFYSQVMKLLISNNFIINNVEYLTPMLEMPIKRKRADFALADSDLNLRLLLEFKESRTETPALDQIVEYSSQVQPSFYGVFAISYRYQASYNINVLLFKNEFDYECLKYINPVIPMGILPVQSPNDLEGIIRDIFKIISSETKGKIDAKSYGLDNEAFYQYELARLLMEYNLNVYPEYEIANFMEVGRSIEGKIDTLLQVGNCYIPIEVKRLKFKSVDWIQLFKYIELLSNRKKFKVPYGVAVNPRDDAVELNIVDNTGRTNSKVKVTLIRKGGIKYLENNDDLNNFIDKISSRCR